MIKMLDRDNLAKQSCQKLVSNILVKDQNCQATKIVMCTFQLFIG